MVKLITDGQYVKSRSGLQPLHQARFERVQALDLRTLESARLASDQNLIRG